MSKNIRAISARRIRDGTLFEALTEAARLSGKLTPDQLRTLARERQVSEAALLGAASFYDFLKPGHGQRRASVCKGTSCRLTGKHADALGRLSARYKDEEIEQVHCMGRCYHADSYREPDGGDEPIPYFCAAASSLFADRAGSLDEFYSTVLREPAEILKELARSDLRGRGGAGFPFAHKLAACVGGDAGAATGAGATTPAGQKYVVCNGDEGDPGAFSDRYLMERRPHRILAGMLAAGRAIGADRGYLYVRAEYPESQSILADAIDAFEKTGAFGATQFRFHIIVGAGSYVCGEETALLNSIEGNRPEVRIRPPYPAAEGLYGRPTLLSNVETLALIPSILEQGADAFGAIGTAQSRGTKLLSLDSGFNNPGVHEVPMGTPLKKVIDDLGGGFRRKTKALQVGGPLGSVVPVNKIDALCVDFESFEAEGFLLGHAGLVAIPHDFPMIDFLSHLFSYMADESCGKCLPCRLGTEKGSQLLKKASAGGPIDRAAFEDLLETLELGSLCALGGGLPLPVRNVMTHFSTELSEHFSP